jgi:RNA polymerase sigma-70 factor (ECF subfamily)
MTASPESSMMEPPLPPAAEPAVRFEDLLEPLLGSLYGSAVHMTRNRADAEDLVQDATLLAFRSFHSFRPGTNFKAWIFRILSNCFCSTYRHRKGERGLCSLEDASEQYLFIQSGEAGVRAEMADPARSAIGRLEAEQVGAALQDLPEEYRLVATLYFMEDFRYQDIAGVLDIPVGTVRSRLHRARRMLQKRLWQIAADQGLLPTLGQEEEDKE